MKLCGIFIDGAGSAMIFGCKVENCNQKGNNMRGRRKRISNVLTDKSSVSGCDVGVFIDMGVVEAGVTSCSIHGNRRYGLIALSSVMGSIRFHGCNFSKNGVGNICRSAGEPLS